MNYFNDFIRNNYIDCPDNDISYITIFDEYKSWVFSEYIEKPHVFGKKQFYEALRNLGYNEVKRYNVLYLRGMRSKNIFDSKFPGKLIAKTNQNILKNVPPQKSKNQQNNVEIEKEITLQGKPETQKNPVIKNEANSGNDVKIIDSPGIAKKLTLNISKVSINQPKLTLSASQSFEADSSPNSDNNLKESTASSKHPGKEETPLLSRPKENFIEFSKNGTENDSPFIYDEKGNMKPYPLEKDIAPQPESSSNKPPSPVPRSENVSEHKDPIKKELSNPKKINSPPRVKPLTWPSNIPKREISKK